MRRLLLLTAACAFAAAAVTPDESRNGWIELGDRDWSKLAFADFILRFEFRAGSPAASGSLFVRAAPDGNPRETGYEIHLGPGNTGWPSGSVVDHARASAGAQPLGQWIPVEVEAAGAKLTVRIFDRPIAAATGLLGHAGLLSFSRGPGLDVRNVRIRPTAAIEMFNGADLTGWKSTGTQPKPGGIFSKVLGKKKPKEAKWTVQGGVIHGESGPGQLESAAPHGDFILQTRIRVPKRRFALLVRGDAGQAGTGYEIPIQPGATGGIAGLAPPRASVGVAGEYVTLTVAAVNRRLQVWVDGVAVAIADDVRPEGPNPKKDARTAPGVIAFYTPEDDLEIEIRSVRIVDLPKVLGHAVPKPAATPPTASTPAPSPNPATAPASQAAAPSAPAAPAGNPQLDVIQQQMQAQQQQKAQQEQKQQQVSALLQKALKSKSPEEQVELYDQILALDPNNQVAYNGRKDAQARIEAAAAGAAKESADKRKKADEEARTQQEFAAAAKDAEDAFVRGDLKRAEQALATAQKIAPNDPVLQALRQRLDGALARKSSLLALSGAGLLACVTAAGAFLVRRRGKKIPYVEIVSGLDKGKKFNIDQEVLHLGAIEQDGGVKNEIVLRDAERMVSRFHAQILNHQGRLFVVDVGSANGTFVDKKRVPSRKPYRLKSGSRVNFGGTCMIRIGYEKRKK